jgi:hypothetical protein
MEENNPHKRASQPITDPAVEHYEAGQKAATRFSYNQAENPFKPETDEAASWQKGFDDAMLRIKKRALAWFLLGYSVPAGYPFATAQYGSLISAMMQTNGQAMACVFVGAELAHADRPAPTIDTARACFEAATYAATGRGLREDLVKVPMAAVCYEAAMIMRDWIVAEDEEAYSQGKATKITIDAEAIMSRLVYGPTGPPNIVTMTGGPSN